MKIVFVLFFLFRARAILEGGGVVCAERECRDRHRSPRDNRSNVLRPWTRRSLPERVRDASRDVSQCEVRDRGRILGDFHRATTKDGLSSRAFLDSSITDCHRKERIYIYLEKPQRFFAYLSGDFRRAAPTMGNSRFDSRRLPRHSVLKVNKKVSPGVLFLFSFFFKSVRAIAKRASRVGRRCFN